MGDSVKIPTDDAVERLITTIRAFLNEQRRKGYTGKGRVEIDFAQGGLAAKRFALEWTDK